MLDRSGHHFQNVVLGGHAISRRHMPYSLTVSAVDRECDAPFQRPVRHQAAVLSRAVTEPVAQRSQRRFKGATTPSGCGHRLPPATRSNATAVLSRLPWDTASGSSSSSIAFLPSRRCRSLTSVTEARYSDDGTTSVALPQRSALPGSSTDAR
jgi:hypothetical protein